MDVSCSLTVTIFRSNVNIGEPRCKTALLVFARDMLYNVNRVGR